VAVVIALVSVAVAFSLHTRLAPSELRWLERQWAQSVADDGERISAERQLTALGGLSDPGVLDGALAALYREEVHRLAATRAGFTGRGWST
jgi:hypothetical protein